MRFRSLIDRPPRTSRKRRDERPQSADILKLTVDSATTVSALLLQPSAARRALSLPMAPALG